MYTGKLLLTDLLQFFAMNANAQLDYAKGIPLGTGEQRFPFGLDHSPLIELANGTHNIARALAAEMPLSSDAVEALENFETVVGLISGQRLDELVSWTADAVRHSIAWRVVRKLSRECLEKLEVQQRCPSIPYEKLVPYIMD